MGVFNFFKRPDKSQGDLPLYVDMHSHVLPGIDDGSESIEDSISMLSELQSLGYRKIIATPHIMGDFFKNTPEIILGKLEELRKSLKERAISIEVEAAAEYYLDEWFMNSLNKEIPLMTFGDKYLLFETSYINESAFLAEAIFKLKSLGYKPVLAHPERYTYLYADFSKFEEIYSKGVLFQINLNSLSGYYSKMARKIASKLIENDMVDFVGTDCHGARHIEALKRARLTKEYGRVLNSKILNNNLLK